MNKTKNPVSQSYRDISYLIQTDRPIDFTQSLAPQIQKITCSVGGAKKGQEAIYIARNSALSDVAQSLKGAISRYKYTIETTTEFQTNQFQIDAQKSKPLSFRHIESIKVTYIDGTPHNIQVHARKMNCDLFSLNNYLKNRPADKAEIAIWEKGLLDILQAIPLDEAEIETSKEKIAEKVVSINNKSPSSSYSYYSIAAMVLVYANAAWQIFSNLGFMMASYLYLNGASLQKILPHLLSDANLPQEHLNSYINQYLEAARMQPELNARALFFDAMNNREFQFFTGSLIITTIMTLVLFIRALCNRVSR